MGSTGDDNYGYTTGQNKQLVDARRMAHHMGEDASHYSDGSGGAYYDTPKPVWSGNGDEFTRKVMENSFEKVYKRVMHGVNSGAVRQVADGWFDVLDYLEHLADQVQTPSDALLNGGSGHPGWNSEGAKAFMARGPGGTLKSLRDWKDAAYQNWYGLLSIASTIDSFQGEMENMYTRYKASMRDAAMRFFEHFGAGDYKPTQGESLESLQHRLKDSNSGALQDKYIGEMKQNELVWSCHAQDLEYRMGQKFWSIMNGDLRGGTSTVYEGPTNAVVPAGMPGMDMRTLGPRNVHVPGMPSIPGGRMPNQPSPHLPNQPPGSLVNAARQAPDVSRQQEILEKGKVILAGKTGTLPDQKLPDVKVPDLPHAPDVGPVIPPALPPGYTGPGLPPMPNANPTLPTGYGPQAFGGPGTMPPGSGPTLKQGVLGANNMPPGGPGGPGGGPGGVPPALARGAKAPKATMPGDAAKTLKAAQQQPGGPGLPPSSLLGKGGRRPGATANDPTRARPGVTADEQVPTRPGATPPGTTPPVLGGKQPVTAQSGPAGPGGGVPGSSRPGTTPPVLNSQHRRKPGEQVSRDPGGPSGPGGPVEEAFLWPPAEAGATAPVIHRSNQSTVPIPPNVGEVPSSLRANRPVMNSPAELAARKTAAEARKKEQERQQRDHDFEQIRSFLAGEEPWTVETPGGAVIANTPERADYKAEPRPTLGAS